MVDNGSQIDLSEISSHLASISKSLAIMALRLSPTKFDTLADRAKFLQALGLETSEIAVVLNTTRNTISVRLSEGKKKGKKRGGKD